MLFKIEKYIYNFISKFFRKINYVDVDFWNDIVINDVEEVYNV